MNAKVIAVGGAIIRHALNPQNERCVEFTLNGTVTIDTFDRERETEGKHRAWYELFPNGQVMVTRVEMDDSRPGRPALWIPCALPYYVTRPIQHMLEDQIVQEQREMLEAYEEGT